MSLHVYAFLLTLFLILSLVLLWCFCRLNLQPSHSPAGKRRPLVHRLLKPHGELPSAYRLKASPDPISSAYTSGSRIHTFMRWLETVSMAALNRSRPFAARPVIQLLLPGTIPLSTV